MTVQDHHGEDPNHRGEVRNTTIVATARDVVQAHTIGTIAFHNHPAPPGPPVPRELPAAPPRFVGRVDHLAALDGRCSTGVSVISAIGGAGGIGKTWLALAWAHRNLGRFPDGQLFVDLRGFAPTGTPADPFDVLGGFLDSLGVTRRRHPADPGRRAALYRSLVADKRMLVVLDNAATADQVLPLLPGGGSCTVLVTSRSHLPALVARHGAHPVRLGVLTDAEAHTLLATPLGTERAASSADAITRLVRLCGGLPLALGLIAARAVVDPDVSLADTVAELHDFGLDALDSEDPTASLPAVLSWSLRRLTDRQRQVFALLGVAPGPDIGLSAAMHLTGLSRQDTHAVLRGLVEVSLIDRHPGGRYGMHDLVRAYASRIADGSVGPALRRVVDFYAHTAGVAERLLNPHVDQAVLGAPPAGTCPETLPDAATAWRWYDAEHACLLAAQRLAYDRQWHLVVWHLAWNLHTFHSRRGHLRHQLAVWQVAAVAAPHLADPATGTRTHRRLGLARANLGQHEEAMAHLHRALALAEGSGDVAQQAQTHHTFTWAWEQRGVDRSALDHALRALELVRTLTKPMWEADILNSVGWFAARLGDHDTARHHCRAALTLHLRHDNTIGEAAALDSLGYIEHHSGRHHAAITHYRRAVALFRDLGNTAQVADTLDDLGHTHAALGEVDAAHEVWRAAVRLYREQGRDDEADRVQVRLEGT
ncbi:ATP-binding protein [Actinokineospora globicatena]|uniref:Tetratricopeptide repeat-containing protein n=1 Tax=Actinokineospora globicatena TaxID=103729 RepID=A0A9W6QIL7_9PSEU|nr:tetratricopeptide repeat protein [Actinokineospora globicatena]GLW89272.1 hypothetical protein Aglo03_00880 [Actinokineospora globicatena]